MLARLRDTKLLVPTIMVVLALPVLIWLGFWQLERLAWKDGLIAAIAGRTKAEPMDVAAFYDELAGKPLEAGEYTRVTARGRFFHDKELYLYAPSSRLGPGFHVVTPFVLAGSEQVLLVNRGFVPEQLKDPAARAEGQVSGETVVTGLVRQPGVQAQFVPENDVQANLWFWRDFDGMIAAGFAGASAPGQTLPIYVDAEAAAPGGWPKGGATELKLANRHLEYALTWFGLAAALAAIYAMYAAGRLRRPDAAGG
jgi:surfeit locus 1 family protein